MGENNYIDKQKLINAIVNSSGSKINKNAIERAKSGDISGLVSGLDDQNKKMLNEAMNDKNRVREILSSKEARELMKKLLGGKGNG